MSQGKLEEMVKEKLYFYVKSQMTMSKTMNIMTPL